MPIFSHSETRFKSPLFTAVPRCFPLAWYIVGTSPAGPSRVPTLATTHWSGACASVQGGGTNDRRLRCALPRRSVGRAVVPASPDIRVIRTDRRRARVRCAESPLVLLAGSSIAHDAPAWRPRRTRNRSARESKHSAERAPHEAPSTRRSRTRAAELIGRGYRTVRKLWTSAVTLTLLFGATGTARRVGDRLCGRRLHHRWIRRSGVCAAGSLNAGACDRERPRPAHWGDAPSPYSRAFGGSPAPFRPGRSGAFRLHREGADGRRSRTSRHHGRRVHVRSWCDGPGVHSAGGGALLDPTTAAITGQVASAVEPAFWASHSRMIYARRLASRAPPRTRSAFSHYRSLIVGGPASSPACGEARLKQLDVDVAWLAVS